ncbi:hypothetical protein [Gluconobacter oxydans]|uniref:hypothetical protein n=1 Tax=Gluconobacter oxydans TaxID=442 RepID=UPI0039E7EBD0
MRAERFPIRLEDVAPALTRTVLALGGLDRQLHRHPLRDAILFRARLEAARQCAAVDGFLVDPWQLAASLEGLRPRIRGHDVFERGSEVDALRHAFEQYQWLNRPTGAQAALIAEVQAGLPLHVKTMGPVLGGGLAFRDWIEAGNARAPFRGALVRLWQAQDVCRGLYPLTGAAAFQAGTSWAARSWMPTWLGALEQEAIGMSQLTTTLERSWRQARDQAGDQRRNSRASMAIDVIAAHPVISATSLAQRLSISVQAVCVLLDRFLERDLIVDVTHRATRRLFALKDHAPLREGVQKPRKPVPGRKPGRPRVSDIVVQDDEDVMETVTPRLLLRWQPDFSELEAAMAAIDALCKRG